MPEQTYKRPRTFFGFSGMPLPGSENPVLSPNVAGRLEKAGLGAFKNYIDPWDTIARSRDYQAQERQWDMEDRVANAEDRFLQSIQEDPQTGFQKFLAQNPLAVMSPMVRAYAVTQDRLRTNPQNKIAEEAASMGSGAYKTFNRSRDEGKSDLEAFADAKSAREKELMELKPVKPGEDDRLSLTGAPREQFDALMSEVANPAEPTDEEKLAFMAPGKKQYSAEEWNDGYSKAKTKKQQDALNKVLDFQKTFGPMYQVPGVHRRGAVAAPQTAPAALPVNDPWEGRTSIGNLPTATPAASMQTPVEEMVTETISPKKDPNDPFNKVRQEIEKSEASEKAGRLEEFKGREIARQGESRQWEVAKGKLLKGIDKDIIRMLSPSPNEEVFTKIFDKAGIDPSEPAFTNPSGRDVSWYEALVALANDPRTVQLQQVSGGNAPVPQGTSPSGSKVVVGQPRKVQ